ncbi:GtrA family protein [Phenylobacterium sp.]|uniref:GtrA family protein n=1 Tax=Phenylobacterium sp. TaxID=1871053 RepID=UPI0035B4CCA4
MDAIARTLAANPRLRRLAGEFSRFLAVGLAATCVHYSVLIGLKELAHAALVPATSAGFVCGAVTSYTLNRRITFAHQPHFAKGLVKFVAVGLVGLSLNALIVGGLAHAGLPYLIAQMIATGTVLFWNFTVARLVVFRAPKAA